MEGQNGSEFDRWFQQAEDDLRAARSSNQAGHNEWACFQAQQAAEKALKAFLFLHGKRQIFSHSVRELLEECQQIDESFRDVAKARRLDEYYIATRYPNGLPGSTRPHEFYDDEEAKECLDLAQSVFDAINRIQ